VRAHEDGAFALSHAQRDALAAAHEGALALDLALERLLLDTVTRLERAHLDVRALKGAAVAHTVYAAPGLRSFRDVDVLVRSDEFDDAVAVLSANGGARRYTEPRPGFTGRFGKGVCVRMRSGLEVDVHRTFASGPFGLRIGTELLFADRAEIALGGRAVPVLPPELRALHAVVHAALGDDPPRLVPLRDVLEVLGDPTLDQQRFIALATRCDAQIVVQRAVVQAERILDADTGATAIGRWSRGYVPSPHEVHALRAYVGPRRSYARQAMAGIGAVAGVRAKVAYARALLLPEPGYVATRDASYVRRLTRGVRLFVDERRTR
jgi:hypothetical protein